MIFGICSKNPLDFQDTVLAKFDQPVEMQVESFNNAGFVYIPESLNTGQKNQSGLWFDKKTKQLYLFQGHIFNEKQLRQDLNLSGSEPFPKIIENLYIQNGINAFRGLNGNFAISVYHQEENKLTLIRDHIGIEPLYYYQDQEKIVFCSNSLFLLKNKLISKNINYKGLYTYFLFNYAPLDETIIANLKKLRPAHGLVWQDNQIKKQRYWFLSFKEQIDDDENKIKEPLLEHIKEAVTLRLKDENAKPGAFLSGGMDSSSIVGLSAPQLKNQMNTFSFRCLGESFDESHYAKFMADAYNTDHHLVEFPVEASAQIVDLAEIMLEPFCDIGIEISTYLLAKFASNRVDYILSGDGGDELFAGHPVYIADKVAKYFDYVPGLIQRPVIGALQYLPDTDKKKTLMVKAKRFSYSFNFPASLFSNRWRIYYTASELSKVCVPDFWEMLKDQNPLPDIERFYQEADGPDYLSKTLYGDYYTVTMFYLTRLRILRHYGIEARLPMFDHKLVEFAAAIPSNLKIKGHDDTKYIQRQTMAGILPDEIVFRKDKLGHSVPMKNWLRDSDVITNLFKDTLSESNLKKRGFFKPEFVQKMIQEHISRKVNHSHRLWALMVLELWLQKHFDE